MNNKINPLKPNEFEILKLIYENKTEKEIAAKVHLSRCTIKAYKKNIFTKLNAKNSLEAILNALRKGYLKL